MRIENVIRSWLSGAEHKWHDFVWGISKREFPTKGFDFGNNLKNIKLPKMEKLDNNSTISIAKKQCKKKS